jgi:VanZ family protein
VVQRRIHGANQPATIGIEGIFKTIRPLFMTLTTGPQGSAIYLNGALAHSFRGYRAANTFTGQLVFGTSPVEASTWQGELYGLAIYSSQLTPKQVLDHYVNWTKQSRPEVNSEERITALYLFDERGGDVVHNTIRPGTDLYIPERYSLLHPMMLQPFWEEYKPTWGHWMDILINIVGFIPLGFVYCAYFSSRVIKHPTIAVTVFGFAVSLVIELLQSYLPTRSSGTTDLLTNTIGTLVGAKFYGLRAVQALLVKMHFVSRGQK